MVTQTQIMTRTDSRSEQRALIFASTNPDADVLSRILQEDGLEATVCRTVEQLCQNISAGAALAVLAEEVLTTASLLRLTETLRQQPGWSDFPLIVMAAAGDLQHRGWKLLSEAGGCVHAILLQRPARKVTLLSAVRAAAQSRARQYQVRDELNYRQQIEAAQRESEERLRLAAEVTGFGTYDFDFAMRRAVWSDALEKLIGVPTQHMADPNELLSHIHPDDRDRFLAATRRSADPSGPGNHELEFRVVRQNGEVRWVRDAGRVIFGDDNGQRHPIRDIGTVLDITERKQAEQALRESEERYRQVVHAMPVAVYTTDAAGRITLFNEAARVLWGREPILGVDLWCGSWRISRPDGSPMHLDECPMAVTLRERRAIQGQEIVVERPDGTRRNVLPYPEPLFDAAGTLVGAVNILVDISERKQAEQALVDSELRFRALFEAMSEGFAFCEILRDDLGQPCDVRCLEVNPAFERHTGLKSDDVLGRGVFEMYPGADPIWMTEFTKAAVDGKPVHFQAMLGPISKWFEVSAYQTGPDRFASVFFDITERKQAEEALKEADRRKDEFLATLAHELRNPLAPLSNAVDLLRLKTPDAVVHQEIRGIMERQVRQLSRLVDDLLDVSRVTRGKLVLRKEPVDLATIVKNAVESSQLLLNAKKQQLTIDCPPQGVLLNADPLRLTQVVANLLNNAGKYTDEGGQVFLTVSRQEDQAAISVRDTGIGIAPEKLEVVFDLFSQIDQSLVRTQGGLGIGLTLAKSFVEMHGGRIEARSRGVGQGSEFVVTLPLTASMQPADVSSRSPSVESTAKRRVLIVDDTRAAAILLGKLLEAMGQDVEICYDAESALDSVRRRKPDVIFSDIAMPHVDGYQLARRLRADKSLNGVTLVALTGYGQHSDRARAQDAGFHHHLVKPVSLSKLQELLNA